MIPRAKRFMVSGDNFENREVSIYQIDNDSDGNPRHVIHWLSLGLSSYGSTKNTKSAGLRVYTGKWFGGGFVFSSYGEKDSLKRIYETLHGGIFEVKEIG